MGKSKEKSKEIKKPKYKLYTIFIAIFLVVGIAMTTVGGYYSTVLTAALEGSTTDSELAEQTYADGIAMNVELEEEGMVLLKNENDTLPITQENKNINLFGTRAADMVYNGSGSSSGSSKDSVSLRQGIEDAGFVINEDLWDLISNATSETDTDVHEGNEVDSSLYPINELTLDQYSGNCAFDKLKEYSDVAVVVIGRLGGEGQDLPRTGYGEDGTGSYLELSSEEKALLSALKENDFQTIVLINSSYAMELGFLDQEAYGVDAALWIGGPGLAGSTAVGEALAGTITPSGRLVDTYAYDLTTQSSYKTSDYYYYWDSADTSEALAGFSNYSEGIYVGYRWYETADAEGYWDNVGNEYGTGYEGVVQYPFGYGISYTTFEQKIESVTEEDHSLQVEVSVKNTGDTYSGKDVIQVYCEAPYTNGGLEKSKVVLAGFAKTDLLEPDAEAAYTVTIDLEDIASYDSEADGGNGAYVMESGDYYFYLSDNAHSWSEIDQNDKTKCYTYKQAEEKVYCGDDKRESDETTAVNQFADADNGIAKLSRADHFANAAETILADISDITVSEGDDLYTLLKTNASKAGEYLGEDGDTSTGKEAKYTMDDMVGAEYDDERWDDLVSQMTIEEMNTLIGSGGWSTAAIESIGKEKTTDIDGPFGLSNYIQNELGNSESVCVSYCSEVVVASTWNTELVTRYGETIGAEGNATGVSGWYAPGANLHRSSFSGRNPEYYSEDAFLSGKMCASTVKGALSKGLYVYVKHFAFNDQEANRTNKENCWMTEQTAREIYLKPFETAVKEGGATGMMASYMWFGGQWCGGNYNLITNVLRGEWGFKGMVVTDNYCAGWMNATKAIMAGTDLILSNTVREVKEEVSSTDEGILAMKTACKHILYTISNAAGNRAVAASSGFDWWNLTYVSVQIICYGLAVLLLILLLVKHHKYKSQNQVVITKESDTTKKSE